MAALGAGRAVRPLWEQLGLRSLYLGDEAVVETGSFSLEGRAIRKVRQSVTRLRDRAIPRELRQLEELREEELVELDAVSRAGAVAERSAASRCHSTSFAEKTTATASSSWDALRPSQIRGFLHFSPELRTGRGLALARCAATATPPTA